MLRDHPEIACAERTGYPSWNQPKTYICEECGEPIEEKIYEDSNHMLLCESCLLFLHEKRWM